MNTPDNEGDRRKCHQGGGNDECEADTGVSHPAPQHIADHRSDAKAEQGEGNRRGLKQRHLFEEGTHIDRTGEMPRHQQQDCQHPQLNAAPPRQPQNIGKTVARTCRQRRQAEYLQQHRNYGKPRRHRHGDAPSQPVADQGTH
ncbi:hypothetical protein D3C72_892700 [compost metagenome]